MSAPTSEPTREAACPAPRAPAREPTCLPARAPRITGDARPSAPARTRRPARLAAALLALAALVGAGPAHALGVATWNLTWLLDRAVHARWVATCAQHGWPTDPDALPAAAREALRALPYCDVHNGMAFPPEDCASSADGWPTRARYPRTHPCRETADLADWSAYEDKLAQLRAAFARLAAEGVSVVALQEVFDEAAVRQVLPPGWSVRTTRELPGSPDIAQQVGVAWAPGVQPTGFEVYAALADSGLPGRTLRPGLAFTLPVGGRPVEFLVVHLKAGCRSRVIDDPLRPNDRPARLDAIATDCAMFRHQLPALEAWIDARAGRDLVVLGDFNRSIFLEPPKERPDRPTRLDGSSPASPVGPCRLVAVGARHVAECPARTGALFPELNDDEPPGAVLWRATFPGLRRGRIEPGGPGDCSVRGTRRGKAGGRAAGTDLAHDGIDHVLLSESLKRRLGPQALELRLTGYGDGPGQALQVGPQRALPSDHCPHWVVLR